MQEQYHKWNSLYLSRDFEMLVFGYSGYPVVLIPPGNCRYYDAKEHGFIDSVSQLLDSGAIKIYCPDTVDYIGLLNTGTDPAGRIKGQSAFESLLLFDIVAFARYESGLNKAVLAGMGLGGYHALNTAFRHPDKVSHLITMGGLFDIKQFLDGYYDDNVYFNNPLDYLPGLEDQWYLNKIRNMDIVLGTGEWDFNLPQNYHMSEILNSKSIAHNLDIRQNTGHDWHWWKEMFREYMYTYFV